MRSHGNSTPSCVSSVDAGTGARSLVHPRIRQPAAAARVAFIWPNTRLNCNGCDAGLRNLISSLGA